MSRGMRTALRGYGLAILLFAVITAISLLLASFSIKISLSVLIVLVIVAATVYGGVGPGLLLSFLIVTRWILQTGIPENSTLTQAAVSYASSASLFVFLVYVINAIKIKALELREQRELLRVTLSSIGDAVITTDTRGKINFLNPTARDLTGWEMESAIGLPVEQVFRVVDEETGKVFERPLKMIDGDLTITGGESDMAMLSKKGEKIPIEHRTTPILDARDNMIGAVIVFRDIRARRATAEALLESEHRLQQSQKMEAIGTLTGGVAHDFNNLLTAILGYTQLAKRRAQSGQQVIPMLDEVEKAGNRASALTRQLLAFSRRQRLEQRNISLTETIGDIFKLLERIIGADVDIVVKHAPDVMPVFADSAQVEQVLMNLCVNARDAMPKGGRLIIETGNVELDEYYCSQYPDVEPGHYVQIRVSDSGTGMDPDTQARIFEPFFTTKDVNKGTGLGLSMAYGIVKQHGGHISVYSEQGHGTAFNIFLPVATDAAAEQVLKPIAKFTEGGSETILIAEDEEMLRNLSRDLLESLGYRVLTSRNGEDAIAVFEAERHNIDLLLFDVVMPVMGGLEAYEQIRGVVGKDIPIVFMTGYSPEFVQDKVVRSEKLMSPSNADVIQKPYTLETLGRAVREALGRNKRSRGHDNRDPLIMPFNAV